MAVGMTDGEVDVADAVVIVPLPAEGRATLAPVDTDLHWLLLGSRRLRRTGGAQRVTRCVLDYALLVRAVLHSIAFVQTQKLFFCHLPTLVGAILLHAPNPCLGVREENVKDCKRLSHFAAPFCASIARSTSLCRISCPFGRRAIGHRTPGSQRPPHPHTAHAEYGLMHWSSGRRCSSQYLAIRCSSTGRHASAFSARASNSRMRAWAASSSR